MIKLKKCAKTLFGRWLKANMGQRRGGAEEGPWRNGGRGGGGSLTFGYSRSAGQSWSGSDSLSWRKSDSWSSGDGEGKTDKGVEKSNPPNTGKEERSMGTKRLELGGGATKISTMVAAK